MRSFTALALGLSLIHSSIARVAYDSAPEVQQRDGQNGVVNLFNRLFRKEVGDSVERRQDDNCYIDAYYNFVFNSSFGEEYCRALIGYPAVTNVVDFTPVSTSNYLYTTIVGTQNVVTTSTPIVTVTVTRAAGKRDAEPESTPAPRDVSHADIARMFNQFRRQNAANDTSSVPDPVMSASFISACGCQSYGGTTTISTWTHAPRLVTRSGYGRSTQTIVTTMTAATTTATVTVGPSGAVESSTSAAAPPPPSSASGAGPEPTAPAFTCPEDNNSTVSQLIGNDRYDYQVLCDTDILDPDSFNDFNYGTSSECAAACSLGDDRLNSPACQGFTYYSSPNFAGYNCFLKPTVNRTVDAIGVDSAILQRIAIGISNDDPQGTNTEAGPFAEPTLELSEVSSAFDSALDGSSTSISVITPGPVFMPSGLLVVGPYTAYSTYVSDGTTFSSGTGFSTYVSTNGSWYSYYYTSFTQAWASAATFYGFSDDGTAVTNTTDTQSSHSSNADGSYVITTTNTTTNFLENGDANITTAVGSAYYAANGTQTSTSATTFWTIQTGATGGGTGGGAGGSGAAVITSTLPGSSWASVIVSSGGTAFVSSGAASGQAAQTPAPSTAVVSTIVSSFGTAWSSGFAISGVISGGGAGGASSTEASGVVSPSGSSIPISSGIISNGIGGASSLLLSGAVPSSGSPVPISSTLLSTGISGEFSSFGSGVIASSGSPVPISSTLLSTGISGEFSSFASGVIISSGASLTPLSSTLLSTGIGGASSGGAPGAIPSSGVIPSSGASFSPISPTITSGGTGFASSTFDLGAIPSSGSPFTNTNGNRSATESTTFPGPSASLPIGSIPIGTGSSGVLFTNSLGTRSGSLPPSGTGPTGYLPPATAPLNTAPIGTSSGFPPLSTGPSGTAPLGTGSSGVPFTNSLGTRSGSLPPSRTASLNTAPIGTGPSSGFPPSATAPTGTAPLGTGSSGVPFTNSLGTRSGTLPPSGTAPIGTAPIGTAPIGTAPTAPSSGFPSASTGFPSASSGFPLGTSPVPSSGFPPYPTAASSCVTNYLGTTTMFMTVTEFGCYSSCPAVTTTEFGCYSNCVPAGGYGNTPLTFGPPAFGGGGGGPTARPSY